METIRIVKLVIAGIVLLLLVWGSFQLVENLDANHIMVIQSPMGKLTWYDTPGPKWQGFGKVTKYEKRKQFWFSSKADQGDITNQSIKIRFNDGGHAFVSGSLAWEMPRGNEMRTALHTKYGSEDAIEQQLIRTVVEKSIYMTGPLMSSKESYAERRSILLQYIEDQIQNGVYETTTRQEKQADPMTGKMKTVNIVEIVKEPNGQFVRTDDSPIRKFEIPTFNLTINEIKYDKIVDDQIATQQRAIMDVQTAMAEARKAEQAAITAEKNGQAEAAKAKWEQEAIKAKAVTKAEQELEVAQLGAKAAAQTKIALTLEGQGEGAKRRAIMTADGGLDKKLNALIEVNKIWADAVKGYQGSWVPTIVMGGSSGKVGGAATDFMQFMTAKSALDLGVSLQAEGRNRTRQGQ
ncbi:MAG: SPFH domain-containing protein [Patescibacteria group bacterium]|nr:SPFH domain-containing protein [Patescibacteria group bacterium]